VSEERASVVESQRIEKIDGSIEILFACCSCDGATQSLCVQFRVQHRCVSQRLQIASFVFWFRKKEWGKRMRKWVHRCIDFFGYVSAAFVFGIFVVMLGAALLRTLQVSVGGSDDIVSWMTAAAAFFGLAHTFHHGDFVRMSLVIEKFGPAVRRWVELAALTVGVLFTAYLTYSVTAYVYDSYVFGDVADGLIPLKKWIPQSSIAIGSLLLFIALIDEWINVAKGNRPDYVLAVEERHAKGDFSEDM
jgi:TRAP-type C4-dicarboxylate transport system permease small subunit